MQGRGEDNQGRMEEKDREPVWFSEGFQGRDTAVKFRGNNG